MRMFWRRKYEICPKIAISASAAFLAERAFEVLNFIGNSWRLAGRQGARETVKQPSDETIWKYCADDSGNAADGQRIAHSVRRIHSKPEGIIVPGGN
jgi:ABC-type sugar transport system substrate-binding protein